MLEGKVFAEKIKEAARKEALTLSSSLGRMPGLAVIIVGEDAASKIYVKNKERACKALGFFSTLITLPDTTTKEELFAEIDKLNKNQRIDGILVQLPLPTKLAKSTPDIIERIDPKKDVDGFHPLNVGRLVAGEKSLVPCTPAGCMKMLKLAGISVAKKRACVIGRSNIVGKPLSHLLLTEDATVTICHSRTQDLSTITRAADILIAAVGRAHFVTAAMVKPGATVIDVGINRIAEKKLVGDVDFDAVKEVAGAITPVPGGVGLLTIATLMANTVQAAKMRMQKS